MIDIQFPHPEFKIRSEGDKEFIFDGMRKKWLLLTPEEWVRQNFVRYLVKSMNYPSSLIAMEKLLLLGELKKRFDILVYDSNHQPWLMVECKGGSVGLESSVLEQLLRYNITIPVKYMIITNGNSTYGWRRDENMLKLIDQLPQPE